MSKKIEKNSEILKQKQEEKKGDFGDKSPSDFEHFCPPISSSKSLVFGSLNKINFMKQGSVVIAINLNPKVKASVIKYNGSFLDFLNNKGKSILQYSISVGNLSTPSEELQTQFTELLGIPKLEIECFLKNIQDLAPSPIEIASLEFSENKLDMANFFLDKQPLFYDENKVWWLWDFKEFVWNRVDETNILILISSALDEKKDITVKSKGKTEILEALKQVSRSRPPTKFPKHWIQFKNIIVDIKSQKELIASPDYFCVNPLPWTLPPKNEMEVYDCPTIDNLFREWVIGGEQDESYIDLLYELFAYSLLPDNPLQKWAIWSGSGANGKGACSRLLTKFVGENNVSSTYLEELSSNRFESAALFNKLVCFIQEASENSLKSSTLIKAATGQDKIKGEFKFGARFEFTPYSKLIMPTNSVPIYSDDSDAWYRRLLLLDFPNKFKTLPAGKGKQGTQAVEDEVPDWEFNVLARKCVGILKRLLDRGYFLNEETIEKTKKKYLYLSNPVAHFVDNSCLESAEDFIVYSEFIQKVNEFLKQHSTYPSLSRKSISKRLRAMGFSISRKRDSFEEGGIYKNKVKHVIIGLKWKPLSNNTNLSDEMRDCFKFLGDKKFKKLKVKKWFDSKKVFLDSWENYFDELVKCGRLLEPEANKFLVVKG